MEARPVYLSRYLKKATSSIIFALLSLGGLLSQPSYTGSFYNSPDQQEITVEFDEALTWTNPGTWLIKIGGGTVAGVLGPGGNGTNILNFILTGGPIEYSDVVAGVTVTYNGNGDVTGMTSGLPLAGFGPETAINNNVIDCSMLTGVQGISVDALSGPCSPVTVTISTFWEWSGQARNSIHFNSSGVRTRVIWNDPSSTQESKTASESSLGSGVFSTTQTFTYPVDGTECVYTPRFFPFMVPNGGDTPPQNIVWCPGGSAEMTQSLTNWNTDALATGELAIDPVLTQVCLGQNFDEILDDETIFNCNRTVEPNKPNMGPRYVQFVYGTLGGRQIPNVYVNGVQVTDASGNLVSGIYVDPTVHYYDSANTPFPDAVTLPITHVGDLANDLVGDQFEVTIRNWGPCNPYFAGLGTPVETTAIIEIVDGPLAEAGADQTICEGSAASLSGSISNTATTASWSTDGDGSFANPNNLNTTYTPGSNDISSGSVWLYLTTDAAGGCPPYVDSLLLTIDPAPTTATTGTDDAVCGTTYPDLGGNTPNAGDGETGQWTVVSGSGVFANAADPHTSVSGLSPGNNIFRWTIYRGAIPCTSSADITISRDLTPAAANAGPDQDICSTTSATLAANAATNGGTGTWTVSHIWDENFNDLPDGTTVDAGPTAWSRVTGATLNYSEIRSGHYEQAGNSSEVVWSSQVINIAGKTDVSISIDLSELGAMESSGGGHDWIYVYYKVNGGAETPLSNGIKDGNFGSATATASSINGNTLQIVIKMRESASNESHRFDNIVVKEGSGADPTFANIHDPTTTVSGLNVGPNTLTWTITSQYGACPGSSDEVLITRDLQPTAANAGTDQEVCNTTTGTLNATPADNNGTGTWSVISGSGTVTSINDPASGVTGLSIGTNEFRWTVTSEYGICSATSDNVIIFVDDLVDGGTIGNPQTVCSGVDDPTTLTNITSASGGDGSVYYYQWQSSTTGAAGPYTNIGGALNVTYDPPVLAVTTWYRRRVSSGVCVVGYSNVIEITVDQPVVGGAIGNAQTICSGDDPAALTNVTPASGGDGSTYNYQWESSTTGAGGPFSSIGGATSASYDPPALANTTWYRRKTSSGVCSDGYSNVIEITVDQPVNGGTIGNAQTVCESIDDPSSLTNVTSASGGDGSTYTYQWESSTTGAGGPFSDIGGATGTTYNPPVLTQTTWYRRRASSGVCADGYSNVIEVTVETQVNAGTVGSDQSLCTPADPALLTELTGPSGGTGTYNYQWQSSTTSGGPYGNIGGATASTYDPPGGLLNSTYYVREVSSTGVCPAVITNEVEVIVNPGAPATAPTIAGPTTVCETENAANYTCSVVANTTNYVWSVPVGAVITSGSGTTSIIVDFTGVAVSPPDHTITVYGENGCGAGPVSANYTVTVNASATASAGSDEETCEDVPFNLSASGTPPSASNYSSLMWTTSGTGSFSNANILQPTYTPGAGETGITTLTLTASGNAPCPAAIDQMDLTITPKPVVNAGTDEETCEGIAFDLSGSTTPPAASNYNTLTWTTTGTGSFDNANILTPVYTPGAGETGPITLRLTASGNGTCAAEFDEMILTVTASPAVSAGSDEETCEDVAFDLSTSGTPPSASNYASLTWTTSGTGSFNNPNALQPIYTPGAGETGAVILTLTANGNGSCAAAVDQMTLTVTPKPVAGAGSDEETCEGIGFDLSTSGTPPSASNYNTLSWSTSGSGTFSNPNIIQPVYTPGAGETGNITLTLTATGNGSCAAVNDQMILTVTPAPAASAGSDEETCEDIPFNLSASATAPTASNYNTLTWTTSGTGTFSDPNVLQPTYTPGAGETGNITLTLTATGNGSCAAVNDQMTLTVTPKPVSNAGSDEETCEGIPFDLSGSTTPPSASNYSSLVWTTSGTGSFSNANILQPVYTPGAGETGNITLTLTTNGNGSCVAVNDQMTLTVTPAPAVGAGSDEETCEDVPFNLATSGTPPSASNYNTLTWTTSGTGSFSNANTLLPTYTPGAGETGNITLTLTATGNGSCAAVNDQMTLTVTPKPAVNAGSDEETCEGIAIDLSSITTPPSASNYSSLIWTTTGTGSFNNNTILQPIYTPGIGETGNITLTLTANGNGSCVPVQDQMTLTVTPVPVISAGSDEESCEGVPFDFATSATPPSASNYASLTWTTTGTGSFNNANILTPIYTPGAGETGNVTMTLTGGGNGSCADVPDQMTLTITPAVIVNAGSDEETCEGTGIDLAAITTPPSASNYATLAWTTSGTGSFSNPAALTPVYTPGVGETGNIVLTLTATGNGSCATLQDQMNLTVTPAPVPSAGSDEETCEGVAFDLSTSGTQPAASNYSSLTWSTSGTGSFSDPNILLPVYTPGAGETGNITLTLTASGNGSCAPVADAMTLTITPLAVANAGSDEETCEDVPFDLSTSGTPPTASNYSTLVWSTSGTGTFNNTGILQPLYTPGAGETGNITLTLTANGNGSCAAAVDQMTLTVTPKPVANAGSDEESCEGDPFDLSGSAVVPSASNYSSLLWTTSGIGSFDNANALAPVYTPGAGETGSITLTLTANGNGSCAAVQDNMDLEIVERPATPPIGGGGGTTLCAGATGEFYSVPFNFGNTYNWVIPAGPVISAGGGVNDNFVVLDFPVSGNYTISVTEYTPAPATCAGPTQNLTIDVYDPPTADAGTDVTICEGDATTLGGTPNGVGASASGGSGSYTYLWSPSVSLDNASAEHPVASPTSTTTYTLYVTDNLTGCPTVNDDVQVTVVPLPVVDAGSDEETCEGVAFDLSGSTTPPSVTNYSSVLWTSSGTGSFDNPNAVQPVYTPGAGETGVVILTLSATGNAPCGNIQDLMSLTITPLPTADAGSDGETCEGVAFDFSTLATLPSVTNSSGVVWTHTGTGSLNNPTLLTPTYTPGAGETGVVTFTITASGNGSCGPVQDNMNLTFTPAVLVSAGSDEETCEGTPFDLSGSTTVPSASNYNTLTWTHNGTGSFDNPNALTPIYTPGVGETGNITLTLTGTGNGNCPDQADQMILTVTTDVSGSAGSDEQACEGTGFDLSLSTTPPSASNYSGVVWTHNGTGTFNNATILTPTYNPGVGETGIVTLTLTVIGNGSCGNIIDDMQLDIKAAPVADAGSNGEICEDVPFDLSTLTIPPSALNYTAVTWSHNGTGSFTDPNVLTPVYNPGVGETGIVTLTMTVTGNAPCTFTSDNMALTINPVPVLDPALDATVCSDNTSGITLGVAGGSVAASGYNINDIRVVAGLVAGGGNAATGNGQGANAIVSDIFTNTTAAPLNVEYDIVPVSSKGCEGTQVTVTLTVNPEPVLDPALDATVCSGDVSGITLNTNGTSVAAASYNITGIRVAAGLSGQVGNATTGNGQPDNAIASDLFTNTTANPLTVEYDIIPVSADGCLGDQVTVTLTVNPEPVLAPGLNNTVCSDNPAGITLATNGTSVNAAGYNISDIRVDAGLVAGGGNATTGNGQPANAIVNDLFTNTTNGTLTVEYDVTPVSAAGCLGSQETIILSVSPEPVMAAGLDATVCSDNASGIVFATNGTSVNAANYNITDIRVAAGLTPSGGNAAIGNGQNANAIASDIFTNTTAGSLTVEYDVIPVSGAGCLGDLVTITLTINPEPVLDPALDATVCSDDVSGIVLNTNGTSVAAASYNILAIRKDFNLTAKVGNASTGNGQAANAIAGDIFTNTSAGPLTVEYDVVPVSADGCLGDLVTITLTVDPEPVLSTTLNTSVCSDNASGITLTTNGTSVAAASYELTDIRVAGGLVPGGSNASTGAGQPAGAIASDVFTNTTAAPLTVEYDVVPISAGGCLGDTATVILTVNPEPVMDPALDATVCSDNVSGITLATNGTSVTAASYNITDIRIAAGLTPNAGNATTGNGQGQNTIAGDIFTNTTAGALTVEYDVTPVSAAGCLGDLVTITLTVDPEPVLDPALDATVCSDNVSGITLNTNGTSVAASTYNILAIRKDLNLIAAGGNAAAGNGQAANAIAGDIFTNTTANPLTVEYDIVPVSGAGCSGDMVTITLTVDPEPVLNGSLDAMVCSDDVAGITFSTNGTSVAAADYNIDDIRVAAGLTPDAGNATIGNGQADNAIAGDIFTNPTANPLTVEYDVVPVSGDGCLGDLVTVILTVNPEPVLDPALDATVCSDNVSGITLNTNGTSVAAATYNITDIRVAAGLTPDAGNAAVGNGQPANAIAGDLFANTTAGTLTVEYDVIPVSAAGCQGDLVTVTLTVDPEPVLDPALDVTVCSDDVSGITLNTNGTSVAAANYNINDIRVAAGLTPDAGNATAGNGQAANAIAGDIFTNTTNSTLTVEYDIVPVSAAGCLGDLVTVTLTVDPKPVLDPALDATVCSDNPTGITLNTNGTSVAAANYNITDIRVDAGLIPDAGNASTGNGQAANAIAGDIFTNTTNGTLTVEYDIIPVSTAGCLGDQVTVILTVDPEPVLDPALDATVCSDNASGITLNTTGASIAAAGYNVTDIRVAAGLTPDAGNASIGNGQPAGAIAADIFTNPTASTLTVEYDIVPVSGAGCEGDLVTVILTVDPEPVLDPALDATVCSDNASGITLNTNGTSVAAAGYDIIDIRVDAGLVAGGGNASTGNGQAANAIAGDVFTNTTNSVLQVEYDIVPVSAAGCLGDQVTVTLTVNPEPVLDPALDATVCSDNIAGIALNTNGTSVAAASYNITDIRMAAGLTPNAGNAVIGNGQPSNAITGDLFTNTTAAPLTIEYDIVPVSATGCQGDLVTVTLTVDPEPVLDPALDANICSDNASGITLNTNGTSVGAASYNIVAIRKHFSLIADPGNATVGNGQPDNAIAGDIFTNTTASPLTVEYDVVPVGTNGCIGDQVTVILTVDPEPVLSPSLNATVCSDNASGITLNTNGVSVAAATYNITDIRVAAGLVPDAGNTAVGNGLLNSAIAGDIFTNTTASTLTVEYDVVPVSAAGCQGDLVTVTLTVNPEPVLDPALDVTVCSDNASGISFTTNGTSVAAASYNITDIRVAAGLTPHAGNAASGNGQGMNAVSGDVFTNTTANPLTVEYDVVPVSAAGCQGDLVTVTLTVDPEPVIDPALDATVCSDNVSGITLNTNGTSVAAADYNITDIRVAVGLIAGGGNATVGNGQPANAIAGDLFTNTTNASLTVEYDVIPVSGAGCLGDQVTITLTVDPKPVLNAALDATVCSDNASGITLSTNGTSVAAANYNITDIRVAAGLTPDAGNAVIGNGQPASAIAGDIFTNTTAGSLTVEYDIVPVSGAGCQGDLVTVILTVDPEPVLDPALDATVCSGNASGITLSTNGTSVAAASYNIDDIRVAAGLTPDAGNAVTGNGQAAGAIAGDIFTNTTAGSLTVEYDIVPVSGAGCLGDLVTITLTVDPEPVLDPALDATVCSDNASGIILNTNGTSVAAANYNITDIRVAAGLTPDAGNAVIGNGQPANAIAGDIFTNTTAGSLTVEYDIVPVSGAGCQGDLVTVILTVDPEPVLDPALDATVCSDNATGVTLATNGTSVAAASYNISDIRVAAGLTPDAGNAVTGNGQPANAIVGDIFTNMTAGPLSVEYDVVPVSGAGCLGDLLTITVTVNPEPVLDPALDATVCSDNASGITLNTNGTSVAAANYNIVDIRVTAGLIADAGNAGTGAGQPANAIVSDLFTNPTATSLTVEYDVIPVSTDGCPGDLVTITLTVDPEPVLDPALDATVCSDNASGITLNTNGTSVAAANYDITDIRVAAGLIAGGGNATIGNGQPANAIAGDIFTNTTAGSLTVEYDVVPISAGGCVGDTTTVILTVDPEPVLDPALDATVCSDEGSGIILGTNGTSVAATTYNIMNINVAAGLSTTAGNATVGNGKNASAIVNDKFTNQTAGSLTVVYDIVPVSGDGCEGDLVQVTLTIDPEPVVDPALNMTICSDETSGLTLGVAGGSVAAAGYNISNIDVATGLTPDAGNAITGNNLPDNALAADKFTNTTGIPLNVVYDVVPVSALGCLGDLVQITLTVNPEPVLDPALDATVCSDVAGGIKLGVSAGSVAAATYDITAINVDAGLVPSGGNATTGTGYASTVLSGDLFTNLTGGALNVVYTVVPVSAAGCAGDTVDVTLTVNSEPVLDPALDGTVCSDAASGILLDVAGGSIPASTYDIFLNTKDAGLIGTATTGIGLASNALASDVFTNKSGGSLQVIYDVTPVGTNGCRGDVDQVTLTVLPEPVLATNLNSTVCSDEASGLTLDVAAGSVAAVGYHVQNINVGAGLVPDAGNAGIGNNLPANVLAGDIFTNLTGGPINVIYDIVPVSADGCEGDMVQVTLTVYPEPILDPALDASVCNGEASGINLKVAAGSVAALTYDLADILVDPSLTPDAGNATIGTGYGSDAIVNDIYTNATNGPLSVIYRVVPVSASGCTGDTVDITLTVNSAPAMLPGLDNTVCSDLPGGIVLDVDPAGVAAVSYTISSINVSAGLVPDPGNATPGIGKSSVAIANDVFTNQTGGALTVVYNVIPVGASGCEGNLTAITLTVDPEPMLSTSLDATVCSDESAGITLDVKAGSVAAAGYNISAISVAPGLVPNAGNASTGNNQPAGAIVSDRFTNLTNAPLQVVYDVVPVSGAGCLGDLVQVTLTVNAEPVLNPALNATVCSGDYSGIVFSVAGGSVAAQNYNLVSVVPDGGLVADAGNATAGTGKGSNAIATDIFTNTTTGSLNVIYSVAPVTASGCVGDTVDVILTVLPEPVLDPALDMSVCSDVATGLTLAVQAGSVAAASYNITNISVGFGLIPDAGNAAAGNGQAANALAGDIFTNTSGIPLNVIYDIYPVSGDGCIGERVQVVVTVNPEPVLNPSLSRSVCSSEITGITMDVTASSVAATSFNILSINVDPALVADAGNAVTGNGLLPDAILNDKFTNTTNSPLLVRYDVVPVSADGCEGDMRQIILTVNPEPVLTPGLAQTLCSGEESSIILTTSNNVPGTIFTWAAPVMTGGMTGGTSGTSPVIQDIFDNSTGSPQTATYRVVPMSGVGCSGDTGTVIITVNPSPTADINGGVDTINLCGSEALPLDGNPSGGSGTYTTHLWSGNIGNLDNVNIQTPTFTSVFSGTYALGYTVTDDNGCSGSDQIVIIVDGPRAIYSADNISGCDALTVNFTNNSVGAVSYTWDFGDGSPQENTVDPVHTFDNITATIQYYEVKLYAESASGCVDSLSQVITVYPTVEANFYINPDTICHGDPAVTLVADPGASAYYWDYGDGDAGYAGSIASHTFSNFTTDPVTYTVTLTTESFYTCSDQATQEITVYPMPVPEFTPSPQSQTWPSNSVTFNNQTNAGTWSYMWNFGDGNTSTDVSPTHAYGWPGIYTVVLTVTNGRCTDSISHNVEIKPIPPTAGFEHVDPQCSPYTVNFVNTSTDAETYEWDFGDGTITDEENPSHTFFHAGTFSVRLTATGPGGTDQFLQLVTVYQTPVSFLGVTPDSVYAGTDAVKYFNYSSYGDTYLWEFGDGDTSTVFEPFHVYEDPGIYDVTLTVRTYEGCEDTYILSPAVTVEPAGDIFFATAFRPGLSGPTTDGSRPPDSQINTVFFPPVHEQIDNYHLQIFDRWGERIFESFDINMGWNGYYKGKLCQQGVYVWSVEGNYANGKPFRKAGDITLLH